MIEVIILAAGKGTRMNSQLPKVMHPLAGKPFIEHVVTTAENLMPDQIHLVLGHGAEVVQDYFIGRNLNTVLQTEQLGTGHAVAQALPSLHQDSTILILYGDVPLIQRDTLEKLLEQVNETSMGLLTVYLDNPTGYGRIIRNDEGEVRAIVEEKDATDDQKLIDEVNSGLMAVKTKHLNKWLPQLSDNNAQGEYYLTDIIALAAKDNVSVTAIAASHEYEVQGVNNREQQADLERQVQLLIAQNLLASGVSLLDPNRFDCRGDISTGSDCVIDINCVFEGEVVLGDAVKIGPNCCIKNSKISSGTVINAYTVVEDAVIETNCTLGPFARIRPGTVLSDGVKIGNFVETKKAVIGKGSKVNHLSYIGDAEVGENVNIGAGTITCNYDGANKFKTTIKNGVFVGSNTALVAPVTIGTDATIGAGSTITQDVEDKGLAIARQKQKTFSGWKRPTKK